MASLSVFSDADTGKYLFHYTPRDAFLAHILPTMRLRLSRFANVNDPRESKDWYAGFSDDVGTYTENHQGLDMMRRFGEALQQSARILCLTHDDDDLDPNRLAFAFGRGYAHPRMWDRYAGHHAGVCIALDKSVLEQEMTRQLAQRGTVHHGAVAYEDQSTSESAAFWWVTSALERLGFDAYVRAHQEQHYRALYFMKNTDWSSEAEYRWVLLNDTSDEDVYVDVRVALSGVIFGPDFPSASMAMVERALGNPDIHLGQLNYLDRCPVVLPLLRAERRFGPHG